MSAGAENLWVGVDIGTQSVKVTIVDDDGLDHASGTHPLTSHREGDRHEQDPAEWAGATAAAMAEAVSQLAMAARARIRAIATCSTSGTIAVVDANGAPVRPALMYDDSRASEQSDVLEAAAPDLWSRLGYRIQPSWAICKILWLATNRAIGSGDRVVHQTDVISEAMAGTPVATDWSSALKSGYNLLERSWPSALFGALGIETRALPRVVAPGTTIGVVGESWAELTGVPSGTAIVAGMTDGCAAQLGAAALTPGDWHSVLGTTLVLKGVSESLLSDASGAIYSHRAPHGGLWLPGGASSVGAGAISALLAGIDLERLGAEAATSPEATPVTYPLVSRGERFPIVRPDAAGFTVLDGARRPLSDLLMLDHDVALRAIFVGVACVERLCFDTLAGRGAPLVGRLTTSGGGSRSRSWTQIRASVLDHTISIPVSSEASLGMAILAAWGAGTGSAGHLPTVARRMSRIAVTVDPDARSVERMNDQYGRFRERLLVEGWIAP